MASIRLWNLDEHLSTTKAAFASLKDMIHHSRESLKSERRKAERLALKHAQTMRIVSVPPLRKKDKDFQRVILAYTPLLNKYCGTLPQFINYSCLIQLYVLFEDRGAALCNELRKRDKTIPLK